MKTKSVFVFSIITIFCSCEFYNCFREFDSSNKSSLNDTIQIKNFETLIFTDLNLSIQMDSVLSDGRCPLYVLCDWEGNAEIRFNIELNKNKVTSILDTFSGYPNKRNTLLDGFRITLIELTPYPVSANVIKQEEYKAKIIIRKE